MGKVFVTESQNIYLPASFMGSKRWASEQITDSLTIAAHFSTPTFFVTMTCNSEWDEIRDCLRPGQDFSDIPCIVIRVFKQKLSLLEQTLKDMFPNAGRILYLIHSVEFQKRGLPHVHLLCKFKRDCIHPNDIDNVVSAEMPSNSADQDLVRRLMLHHHPPLTVHPLIIVNALMKMDVVSVASDIHIRYKDKLLWIPRVMYIIDDTNQEMNGLSRTVFRCYGNSNVTLTWKLRIPLIFFNTFSNISTKVCSLTFLSVSFFELIT
jgi:hypothetical protein